MRSALTHLFRLLDLVTEDAALEDTIYHLGRGLNSDMANIDLDRFLKVSLCLADRRKQSADTLHLSAYEDWPASSSRSAPS